jgi:hypothetical protein
MFSVLALAAPWLCLKISLKHNGPGLLAGHGPKRFTLSDEVVARCGGFRTGWLPFRSACFWFNKEQSIRCLFGVTRDCLPTIKGRKSCPSLRIVGLLMN